MNKVTVTKAQMEAIEGCRDNKESLNGTLSFSRGKAFGGSCVCINDMTVEQIVLAWHGHAEVKLEYVGFDEAIKARREGERVLIHAINRKVLFRTNERLNSCFIGNLTINELLSANYEIYEVANND